MSDILELPVHNNPSNARAASAPYNFVSLPDTIVTTPGLPPHDRYDDHLKSGWFDVTLTTKSPLYVRASFTLQEYLAAEREKQQNPGHYTAAAKNKPGFFYTRAATHPVIPGSSLRGMLRAMLEIAAYAKLQPMNDRQLFYRTVDDTSLGRDHYRARMGDYVESGLLRKRGTAYHIKVCAMTRVHRDKLGPELYDGNPNSPMKTPRWQGQPHQYQACWVKLAESKHWVEEILWQKPEGAGYQEGRLVITGDMRGNPDQGKPGKKKEFVLLLPSPDAEEVPVPSEMLDRFHADDQISQWQRNAFDRDRPHKGARERSGMLRRDEDLKGEGDPIFFLREHGSLTFFGRARHFRLPYKRNPVGLVPQELHNPAETDLVEAIFGFVKGAQGAYAGRISVEDAVTVNADVWLSTQPITPKILSAPKPTAFQHYLTQSHADKDNLNHFDTTDAPVSIRGFKRYWHQGPRTLSDIREDGPIAQTDTQHTRMKPVKAGVTFSFRIHFENLSDIELGALCWALKPVGKPGDATEYCHSLGMGKPLGMGAVALSLKLQLISRAARYGSLFDGAQWQSGADAAATNLDDYAARATLTAPFEKHILAALRLDQKHQRLYELKRIGMLLKLLEWPGQASEWPPTSANRIRQNNTPNTRNMQIQLPNEPSATRNEFRPRCVLPDPSAFSALTGDAKPVPTKPLPRPQPMESAGTAPLERESEVAIALRAAADGATQTVESNAEPQPPFPVPSVFMGKVREIREGQGVVLEVPGINFETQGFAFIALADPAGQNFQPKQDRRCELIRIYRTKDGLWQFNCKLAPKAKKK